jgi:hypothetical protein
LRTRFEQDRYKMSLLMKSDMLLERTRLNISQ